MPLWTSLRETWPQGLFLDFSTICPVNLGRGLPSMSKRLFL